MAAFSRTSRVLLAALILLSLALPSPARAAMNAEDGKRLKTLFTDMIDRYRHEAEARGGKLVTEGEVMVEPGDNYYAITLPYISAIGADKSKINLGMIAINAVPGDKPQEWKMTVAVPTPVTMYSPGGTESAVVEIGSQNFAGVFHEQFRNFVRLNAKYKNITFTDLSGDAKILIPDIAAVYDLKEGQGNLWSGPMNLKAQNIQALFNKSGGAAKIREVAIDTSVKDYAPQEALAWQDKMAALAESLDTDKPSVSNQHFQGIYNTLFDFMTTVWDGFGSRFSFSGIEIIKPPAAGKPASTIKIERVGLGLEGNGFRSDKVMLRHTLNLTDLAMTPQPQGLGKAAPTTVNIDMALNNLPMKELVKLGDQMFSQSSQNPQSGNVVILNGLATAQQLLTDAGTTLTVRDTQAGNQSEYNVLLNGAAKADIKSLMGATGKARLEIFGIEKLIGYAQQAAADPALTAENKTQAQNLLQTLTVLQMVGQQGKNAKGQNIRSYDFELTPDGKTLLNGADLMTVIGSTRPTP